MPVRKASAKWNGDLKAGKGEMEFGSGAYRGGYTFNSRMEDGPGTNPEELIAAAHAGCFSMAFANGLASAGFTPNSVNTNATANFNKTDAGWTITSIDLDCQADVPNIDEAKFQEIAAGTKQACPVSRALAATPINLNARLVGAAVAA